MSGNSFGRMFRVTTFGESHGKAVGCVVDGCPAGLELDEEFVAAELRRRRPGNSPASTQRKESDEPEILSGVFGGKTLGTPIAILIRNADPRSGDYEQWKDVYRPGHADYGWDVKYGLRDWRGGGRSSGRETAGRVAAGAVAKAFLAAERIQIRSWVSSIAGVDIPGEEEALFDLDECERNPYRIPYGDYVERVTARVEELRQAGDSAGGMVSCRVSGMPAGLGEPVFDKLPALLARAILSIGAAKGIEFGRGFAAAGLAGSENNDAIFPSGLEPAVLVKYGAAIPAARFSGNNSGGTLGGISTGADLFFRCAFKPAPTIAMPQNTIDSSGRAREIFVRGRHDITIVPRASIVVEAMTAAVLADLLLRQRCARA